MKMTKNVSYKLLWNSNFKVKKIIISHICYLKQKAFPTVKKDLDKGAILKVNNQSITFWAAPLLISSEVSILH